MHLRSEPTSQKTNQPFQMKERNSVRCEARTSQGKQCKKMSVPGYRFCRVHSFGRSSGVPWYQNGIFQIGAGIVASIFIGWYFFAKGPDQTKQDQGLTNDQVLISGQKNIQRSLDKMRAAQNDNEGKLLKQFPLGYVVFTATVRKEIIPLTKPTTNDFEVDWHSAAVREITSTNVLVAFPDFVYRPINWRVNGMTVGLDRKEGSGSQGMVSMGEFTTAVKVIHDDEDGVIIVLGLTPDRRS